MLVSVFLGKQIITEAQVSCAATTESADDQRFFFVLILPTGVNAYLQLPYVGRHNIQVGVSVAADYRDGMYTSALAWPTTSHMQTRCP